MCDKGNLELGEDPVPWIKVSNHLKSIFSKPITYENTFPLIHWALLSERQVNYVEYVVVTRDTENLGFSRKEMIQVISDIGQENLYVQ